MLCAKIGWNWLSGSGEEDILKFSSMYFHLFIIISPWKKAGRFFWTNLNSLHSMMLCAKFGWNWPSCSGEEDENVKSLRQRRRQRRQRRRTADKFWSEKLTRAFGSGELKTSSVWKHRHCRWKPRIIGAYMFDVRARWTARAGSLSCCTCCKTGPRHFRSVQWTDPVSPLVPETMGIGGSLLSRCPKACLAHSGKF